MFPPAPFLSSEIRDDSYPEGYTNDSWPFYPLYLYTLNYYDDYDFPNYPGPGYDATAAGVDLDMTRGLPTASAVKNLDEVDMLWRVNYYNSRGELIENITQNHIGGTDRRINAYSFTGQLSSSRRIHSSSSVGSLEIADEYQYDHAGRKKQSIQTINGGTPVILSALSYSGTGQLLHKQLHGNLLDISYVYNERGWLQSQSSALFSETLHYQDPVHGAPAQYNGNISEQEYNSGSSGAQYVTYSYDAMNRLTDGVSSSGASETGISYDKMGNLMGLTRAGLGSLSYSIKLLFED